ncbi:MAG: hypothetical protein AB7K09_19865 [Planctomycetota bacterium]
MDVPELNTLLSPMTAAARQAWDCVVRSAPQMVDGLCQIGEHLYCTVLGPPLREQRCIAAVTWAPTVTNLWRISKNDVGDLTYRSDVPEWFLIAPDVATFGGIRCAAAERHWPRMCRTDSQLLTDVGNPFLATVVSVRRIEFFFEAADPDDSDLPFAIRRHV